MPDDVAAEGGPGDRLATHLLGAVQLNVVAVMVTPPLPTLSVAST